MVDPGKGDPLRARRLLARHGDDIALDLVDHRIADVLGKVSVDEERIRADADRLRSFRRVVERERRSPHRIADLAVNGTDLIQAGFTPGPKLGETLRRLLHDVVVDPSLNTREELLARANKLRE
jgi:hypothetical protein